MDTLSSSVSYKSLLDLTGGQVPERPHAVCEKLASLCEVSEEFSEQNDE